MSKLENWRGWTVRLEPRSVWVMACAPSQRYSAFQSAALCSSDHVRTYTVSPHHLANRPSPAASLLLYESRGFILSSPFCSETPEWLPTANGLVIWLLLGPSKSVLDLPFHPIPCFPYYTVFYHMNPPQTSHDARIIADLVQPLLIGLSRLNVLNTVSGM